jgi:hypothetical protein
VTPLQSREQITGEFEIEAHSPQVRRFIELAKAAGRPIDL